MYTLIDISNTGCTDPKNFTKKYKQMQNLNCLLQSLGLRAQVTEYVVKKMREQDITNFDFGTHYTGDQRMWKMEFASDTSDSWLKDDEPLYHALHDVDQLPIYAKLSETIELPKKKIITLDPEYKNTYFIL